MDKFLWYCLILAETISLERSLTTATVCATRGCYCTNTTGTTVTVACKVQDIQNIQTRLDGIQDQIHILDLSSANLSSLQASSFTGFNNLVNLNLSHNNIKQWVGEVTQYLPKLKTLDATGNKEWLPRGNVLMLPSLQEIRGVTWSQACSGCTLQKHSSNTSGGVTIENLRVGVYFTGIEGDCRATQYTVSEELKTFAKYGFYASCLDTNVHCLQSAITSKPIHRCWEVDNYILNLEYIIGTLALVLNIIVIYNTLTDKHLRDNVALLLVANMAASDSCIAVYSIVLTSARKLSYQEFLLIMNTFCPCVGFIWLAGQLVTVTTSMLLTVERWLAIVYVMKPEARLRRQEAIICVVLCWVAACIVATLPATGIGIYTSNTYCVPVRPLRDIPHMFGLGIGIGSVALLIYLATIPLYVHIYVFVKRTKRDAPTVGRVNKDCCLARRIAIMVLSNMFFFCIPVFIGLLWIIGNITKGMSPIAKEIITGVLPTVCFTINALMNPLLYAFRNDKFMHSLRTRLQLCRNRANSASLTMTMTRSGFFPDSPKPRASTINLEMPRPTKL